MENTKEKYALGIDLGTTNSCVAVYRNGRADTIPHTITSSKVTPSWVTYTNEQVLVGQIAKDHAFRNPLGSVYGIKRVIGKKYNDPVVQRVAENWKFDVVEDSGALKLEVFHKKEKKQVYPEQISGLILREMKEIAEAYLGENNITDAVITVPAYFNDHQRQATIDAAKIAKLNVLRLINEPTAAAIAYLFDKPERRERNILVYDLGGGTFDVSIVSLEGSNVKVKATHGDTNLGGANFDDRCVAYFWQIIQDKYQINMAEAETFKLSMRLRVQLEKAKHDLSSMQTTHVEILAIWKDYDFQETFTRARFNDINADLYQKTLDIVEQCVSDANLSKDDIDDILLVGGSSRIPLIEEKLKVMFEKPIRKDINRDEAVALGAAILAAKLNGSLPQELNIQDVTSMSLGIETMDDKMSFLVNRNSQIPTKAQLVYTTAHPEDDAIRITILEGDNESAKKNLVLGVFDLLNLPKDPSVKVTFKIDINGILTVKAVETSTGIKKTINVTLSKGGLSAEEILRLQRNSASIKENNEECNTINDKINEFESYLFTLKNDVKGNKFKISAKERDLTLNMIEDALKWVISKDALDIHKIDKKHKTISNKCSNFLKQ